MPDIYLVKAEKLIVFDNFNQKKFAIYNANPSSSSYEEAINSVSEISDSIDQAFEKVGQDFKKVKGELEFQSNFSKKSSSPQLIQ
ncbi:MAG: hypothetical protein Ct9H90mP22_6950 [Gammaproteobacteria bacterium]|nr:MAG: hypothetical protein Ct9H90mP22_6950 [Gammaproteobacteria bacterium]